MRPDPHFLAEKGNLRYYVQVAYSVAEDMVKKIQGFITENMYTCTPKILRGLGKMYSGGGEFTENIDSYGGEGTGAFLDKAIQIYCDQAE